MVMREQEKSPEFPGLEPLQLVTPLVRFAQNFIGNFLDVDDRES